MHDRAPLAIDVGMNALERGGDGSGLGAGLRRRRSRRQPGDPDVVVVGSLDPRSRGPERQQHLHLVDREAEGGRHHADDGEGSVIELDLPSDDIATSAEPVPPRAVGQDGHALPFGGVGAPAERDTDRRRYGDDVEESAGDETTTQAIRFGHAGQIHALREERGEGRQRRRLCLQVAKVLVRDACGTFVQRAADGHDGGRLGERKRLRSSTAWIRAGDRGGGADAPARA